MMFFIGRNRSAHAAGDMLEVGTDGCLFKFQAFRGHALELFL